MGLLFRQWPALPLRVGALPYRLGADGRLEILLIRRKGHGFWSIPKGHRMAGRTNAEAAAVEAAEEAGVTGRIGDATIATYVHIKSPKRDTAFAEPVEVHLFPLAVDTMLDGWKEQRTRERRWASRDEAIRMIAPGSLRTIVAAFDPAPARPNDAAAPAIPLTIG